MAQLRQDYELFQQQDAEILVIGPEDQKAFRDYWEKQDFPFIGMPDPTHSVLKLYGQEVNLFKLGRQPAMAIIDKKGIVRFVHYGHTISDIPANKDVLSTLANLNQEL
jgi:peroxiredoxin Q/BCP